MNLTLDTVTAIGREVAEEYDPPVDILGVASGGGDSGRVELLVTIRKRDTPAVVMLNVTRTERGALEDDLREKFRHALDA